MTKGQNQIDGSQYGCCSIHLTFLLDTYITWYKGFDLRVDLFLLKLRWMSALYLTKKVNWKGYFVTSTSLQISFNFCLLYTKLIRFSRATDLYFFVTIERPLVQFLKKGAHKYNYVS